MRFPLAEAGLFPYRVMLILLYEYYLLDVLKYEEEDCIMKCPPSMIVSILWHKGSRYTMVGI